MTLDEYMKQKVGLSVTDLAAKIGAKDPAQVRQWQHGYAGRMPSAPYCVAIEKATGGAVMRWDLRPDWRLWWPELARRKGAPQQAAKEAE